MGLLSGHLFFLRVPSLRDRTGQSTEVDDDKSQEFLPREGPIPRSLQEGSSCSTAVGEMTTSTAPRASLRRGTAFEKTKGTGLVD